MSLLQSYVIMLDGQLLEMEDKRKRQISDLKSGRGRIRNLGIGVLRREFLKQYLTERQSGYLESTHTRVGCLREMVPMRESTVILSFSCMS